MGQLRDTIRQMVRNEFAARMIAEAKKPPIKKPPIQLKHLDLMLFQIKLWKPKKK